jgi:MFS family permease
MGVLALVLGLLTVTDSVSLWMVYVLAVLLGLANAIDNPTRQAFVLEMVGAQHLRNAVTLNSVLVNAARAIGPRYRRNAHRDHRRRRLLPGQCGYVRRRPHRARHHECLCAAAVPTGASRSRPIA